jgi:hypothetical protein
MYLQAALPHPRIQRSSDADAAGESSTALNGKLTGRGTEMREMKIVYRDWLHIARIFSEGEWVSLLVVYTRSFPKRRKTVHRKRVFW